MIEIENQKYLDNYNNKIGIHMQEELNRIRAKDYTHLDEKLFTNLNMTTELDTTLAQLAELQKYLKAQIDGIQDHNQKQAALRASRTVMEIGGQLYHNKSCTCFKQFESLKCKIGKIGRSLKKFKEGLNRELTQCTADLQDIVNDNLSHLIGISARKNMENGRLKQQVSLLEEQIVSLKKQNEDLILNLKQWEEARNRRRNRTLNNDRISNFFTQENYPTQEFNSLATQFSLSTGRQRLAYYKSSQAINQQEISNETPRLPMPLRKQMSNRQQSAHKFQTKGFYEINTTPPKGSLSILDATMRTQQKENDCLKKKGVNTSHNGKSTKKITLVNFIM